VDHAGIVGGFIAPYPVAAVSRFVGPSVAERYHRGHGVRALQVGYVEAFHDAGKGLKLEGALEPLEPGKGIPACALGHAL